MLLVHRDTTNSCCPPGQYGGDYRNIEKRRGSFRFPLSGWDDCPTQSSQGKEPDSSQGNKWPHPERRHEVMAVLDLLDPLLWLSFCFFVFLKNDCCWSKTEQYSDVLCCQWLCWVYTGYIYYLDSILSFKAHFVLFFFKGISN